MMKQIDRKIVPGPYGMRCPCCNNFHSGNSQKVTKQAINRRARRKQKQEAIDIQ
jgi:hypothetical protein